MLLEAEIIDSVFYVCHLRYIYIYSTYIYIFIYLFIHIVSKKIYKFKVHPCCGWKGLGACVEMVNIVWSTIDFPNEIAVINPT